MDLEVQHDTGGEWKPADESDPFVATLRRSPFSMARLRNGKVVEVSNMFSGQRRAFRLTPTGLPARATDSREG